MSHVLDLACPRAMNKILLAVAVLGLAACGENHPPSPDPDSELSTEVVRQAQLVTYPACDSLDAAVKARLIQVMRANLAASLQTALPPLPPVPQPPPQP